MKQLLQDHACKGKGDKIMVDQLSVFVENKPGAFRMVTEILCGEKIQMYAFCSVDSPEFGILRIVVDRPEDAEKLLADHGFMVKKYDVIAVRTEGEQSLNALMDACTQSNISINYMYSAVGDAQGRPAVILHTEYPDETESMLKNSGFACLSQMGEA